MIDFACHLARVRGVPSRHCLLLWERRAEHPQDQEPQSGWEVEQWDNRMDRAVVVEAETETVIPIDAGTQGRSDEMSDDESIPGGEY